MSILQYLKDTRSELNHVAWPTRVQTSIFTALVIGLSLLVSLYLGFFDYLFTSALSRGLEMIPRTSQPTLDLINLATTTTEIGTTTEVE